VRLLPLSEYRESAPQQLTVFERDSLAKLVPDLTIKPVVGLVGWYTLIPASTVGIVDLGTLAVTIAPKLEMARVLFLISYGLDRFAWQHAEPALLQAPDVFEAVVQSFAAQVARATRLGLLHGYREIEDALPVVRGRLRLGEHLTRRFGRMLPVEVTYDDFTQDIDENMLPRAALNQLKGLRVRSPQTTKALRRTEAILREVESRKYDSRNLPTITYSRLNRHYQSAVELAKFILRSTSFEIEHGRVQVRSFLLNMDDVFEDFVYVALCEALSVSQREFIRKAKGKAFRLDTEGMIPLEPDVSWWDGNTCRFVGDVKYKSVARTVPNADLYQALAYAVAADLPGALLIYGAQEREVGAYRVVHAGKTLDVVALDLTAQPSDILRRIVDVAERVRTFSSGQISAA
jgi:5-methylcytosine-specific restriction enzyme subunit McrC